MSRLQKQIKNKVDFKDACYVVTLYNSKATVVKLINYEISDSPTREIYSLGSRTPTGIIRTGPRTMSAELNETEVSPIEKLYLAKVLSE